MEGVRRHRNPFTDSRSYPRADINSDHNLITMKCNLKFKKIIHKKKITKFNGKLGILRKKRQIIHTNNIQTH